MIIIGIFSKILWDSVRLLSKGDLNAVSAVCVYLPTVYPVLKVPLLLGLHSTQHNKGKIKGKAKCS